MGAPVAKTGVHSGEVRKRGRPRQLDREDGLEAVTGLFWRHGYDGVSLEQITATLGVSRPSIYCAFESKTRLFRMAVEQYQARSPLLDLRYLSEARSPDEAARMVLDKAAATFAANGQGLGCMVLTGALEMHPQNAGLASEPAKYRAIFREELSLRLTSWMPEVEAARLSRDLVVVMQGMAIQAHDGASLCDLEATARCFAAALTRGGAVAAPEGTRSLVDS